MSEVRGATITAVVKAVEATQTALMVNITALEAALLNLVLAAQDFLAVAGAVAQLPTVVLAGAALAARQHLTHWGLAEAVAEASPVAAGAGVVAV